MKVKIWKYYDHFNGDEYWIAVKDGDEDSIMFFDSWDVAMAHVFTHWFRKPIPSSFFRKSQFMEVF